MSRKVNFELQTSNFELKNIIMKKLTILIFALLIIEVSAFAQPCLPGGITFSTQDQIDNFQTNYPNCTEIEGGVVIEGSDITNLDGLNVITSIGEYL